MATRIKTNDIADGAVTAPKLGILTTKGDVLGYGTTPARIPVGTNGQVLTADSAQANGVKWADPAAIPGMLTAANFVDNEVPTGTVNGTNVDFTLASTPAAGSLHLHKNGLRQSPGASKDYTITGATITFVAGNVPQSGDLLLADYRI